MSILLCVMFELEFEVWLEWPSISVYNYCPGSYKRPFLTLQGVPVHVSLPEVKTPPPREDITAPFRNIIQIYVYKSGSLTFWC